MKRLFALAALATTLSTHSFAAPETYTVDNEHTYPSFTYNHLGFSTQTHRFLKTSGTVVWDKAAETGSVDITIDAKSVDAGSAIFAEHIQAPELFDTANYPTITFKSTGVKFKDADLIGMPLRVTIGAKGLAGGNIELKPRTEPDPKKAELVPLAGAAEHIAGLVQRGLQTM